MAVGGDIGLLLRNPCFERTPGVGGSLWSCWLDSHGVELNTLSVSLGKGTWGSGIPAVPCLRWGLHPVDDKPLEKMSP